MHTQDMEQLQQLKEAISEKAGVCIYKHVVILDMEGSNRVMTKILLHVYRTVTLCILSGIGRKHLMGEFKAMFKLLANIDSNFYPEGLHRMFLINVPFIFKVLFYIIFHKRN